MQNLFAQTIFWHFYLFCLNQSCKLFEFILISGLFLANIVIHAIIQSINLHAIWFWSIHSNKNNHLKTLFYPKTTTRASISLPDSVFSILVAFTPAVNLGQPQNLLVANQNAFCNNANIIIIKLQHAALAYILFNVYL